jgi:hypothetical protein
MKKLTLLLALLCLCLAGPALAWPTWTGTATITPAAGADNVTSTAVSLPRDCKSNVGVLYSGITSATVAVHVSNDGTNFSAYSYAAGAAAAPAAYLIGAATGGAFEIPSGATAFKYFRFVTGAQQSGVETFTVTCN